MLSDSTAEREKNKRGKRDILMRDPREIERYTWGERNKVRETEKRDKECKREVGEGGGLK